MGAQQEEKDDRTKKIVHLAEIETYLMTAAVEEGGTEIGTGME